MIEIAVGNQNGLLERRKCRYDNRDPKKCLECPNILSKRGFFGRIDWIICRNMPIPEEERPDFRVE